MKPTDDRNAAAETTDDGDAAATTTDDGDAAAKTIDGRDAAVEPVDDRGAVVKGEGIGIGTVRDALEAVCPGIRVDGVRPLDAGYTSRQWVADTDEGRLLVKAPVRERDPEHLRRLVATTRRAAEAGVPVVRYRAVVAHSPAFGGPMAVQEFADGTPADQLWDAMDSAAREAFAADLGSVVGRLHASAGPWFGDVLGRERHGAARAALHALVERRLGEAPPELRAELRAVGRALHAGVETVPMDEPASLLHGDLWRPNVLLRGGRIQCLLDFEHGGWGDRFLDFGKLEEHVFAHDPIRPAFLEAYAEVCPLPAGWEERAALGRAVHALSMAAYFAVWNPEFVPQYTGELTEWAGRRSAWLTP